MITATSHAGRAAIVALLLTVTLLAGYATGVAAQPAPSPGLGIRLLEAPRELADDPRAQVYVIDHLIPGATLERRIEVSNGDRTPMDVDLYGAAADVVDGWAVAEGRGGNALASWITVEPSSLRLQPGERREALVTIRVPGDAGGGERYAAVLAETRGRGTDAVELVNRVGIRVYLSVGGGPAPLADFVVDTLTAGRTTDGVPYLLVGITNTGDRAIDAAGEIELLDGPGGARAGPFPVTIPRTVGPGGRGALQVPMAADIPAGPWRAVATIRSGLLERPAEAEVTFPTAGQVGDPVAAEEVERKRRVLLPLASLLLLAVLGALLFVWWARRRRQDDETLEREPVAVA